MVNMHNVVDALKQSKYLAGSVYKMTDIAGTPYTSVQLLSYVDNGKRRLADYTMYINSSEWAGVGELVDSMERAVLAHLFATGVTSAGSKDVTVHCRKYVSAWQCHYQDATGSYCLGDCSIESNDPEEPFVARINNWYAELNRVREQATYWHTQHFKPIADQAYVWAHNNNQPNATDDTDWIVDKILASYATHVYELTYAYDVMEMSVDEANLERELGDLAQLYLVTVGDSTVKFTNKASGVYVEIQYIKSTEHHYADGHKDYTYESQTAKEIVERLLTQIEQWVNCIVGVYLTLSPEDDGFGYKVYRYTQQDINNNAYMASLVK